MERCEEFLNVLMSNNLGTLHFRAELKNIKSLMIEMKGVIPLPPLTITSMSCLHRRVLPLAYPTKEITLGLCDNRNSHELTLDLHYTR